MPRESSPYKQRRALPAINYRFPACAPITSRPVEATSIRARPADRERKNRHGVARDIVGTGKYDAIDALDRRF